MKSITVKFSQRKDRRTGELRNVRLYPASPKPLTARAFAIEIVYKSSPKRSFYCESCMIPSVYDEFDARRIADEIRSSDPVPIEVNVVPVNITQIVRKRWTTKRK
jgi:hypothetical protein